MASALKTPVRRFLNIHYNELFPEGQKPEFKKKSGCKPIHPTEQLILKKKRKPCAEAGIIPIKMARKTSADVQPSFVSVPVKHIEKEQTFVTPSPNKQLIQVDCCPGVGRLGVLRKTVFFKTHTSSALRKKLQHQRLDPTSPKLQKSIVKTPVSSSRKKKSRIPILIDRIRKEKIAKLERRKQQLTEELNQVGVDLDNLKRGIAVVSKEAVTTKRNERFSPLNVSNWTPISDSPIVLNFSPALLSVSKPRRAESIYENLRSVCTYLRTPQHSSFKQRGTPNKLHESPDVSRNIQSQLARLYT